MIARFKIIFFFASLYSCAIAMEQGEYSLDINIGSRHSEGTYWGLENRSRGYIEKKYNENNFGVGLSYGYRTWVDFKTGFFENSYEKNSFYIGAFIHKDIYLFRSKMWLIAPGVNVGGVTGYNNTPMKTPVIAPLFIPAII